MSTNPRQRYLSLRLRLPPDLEEPVVVALHEAGCLGMQASCGPGGGPDPRLRLTAWFAGGEALRPLRARLRRGMRAAGLRLRRLPRLATVPDGGWVEAWQRSLRPMRIGRRILVLPEGCRAPARGRVVIRMRFGQAFGTGEHPSTRLALRLLERSLRPGDRVIDVGTGSGILAMAAGRLGARSVLAVDNDAVALDVARRNLADNRLAGRILLRRADAGVAFRSGRFDLAMVNIGAPVISDLLPSLGAGLLPGGRLVLSGILVDDEAALLERAARLGLGRRHCLRRRPWSALLLERVRRHPAA